MYPKSKKGLGQIFLIDQNIQRKIISSCKLKSQDTVVEIGAGGGELTRLIADRVDKVFAVEIDPYLVKVLKYIFKKYKNIRVIKQDILNFNLRRYFRKSIKVKIIGNIPYYITTPIIEHLFNFKDKIASIFITVQKEFARRMTAKPGSKDYGPLSCFIQYYTEPQILFSIKRTCFRPIPKVDSCLVHLEIREAPLIKTKDEKLFFKIIRVAFSQRRKTLRNSLKGTLPQEKLKEFFNRYGIDCNSRPENLSLRDFSNLINI